MSFGFQNWCAPRRSGVAGTPAAVARALVRSAWLLRSWFIRVAFCRRVFCSRALCSLALVGSCVLLGAGRAWAAADPPPEEPAPMCDPDGASVAAPEDIPEVDSGRFEALPCEAQLLLSGLRLDTPEPGRKFVSSSDTEPAPVPHAAPSIAQCDGVRVLSAPFPARAEPASALFGARAGLTPHRGFARGLFRPPVARG
jgi:hypothetical protein